MTFVLIPGSGGGADSVLAAIGGGHLVALRRPAALADRLVAYAREHRAGPAAARSLHR